MLLTVATSTFSSAVFPLAHAAQPLGLLIASSREPDFFDEESVIMLVEAARIVAASLHFARLHELVRAEQGRAEVLQEFGFRCALATSPEEVCDAVLSVGGPVVGARTVGITLVRPHDDELQARIRDIARDEYEEFETSLGSTGLLAQAVRQNEMVSAATRQEIDRGFPGSGVANADYLRSAYAIPLRTGGRAVGSIGFAFEAESAMTESRLKAVRLVAEQSAAALDRVRLDEQRRMAFLEFQASLLPASLPETAHVDLAAQYSPAPQGIEVRGDWYDAFVRPDGSVCLVVGDAAGKGITAATTVGALRHIVRYFAHHTEDPGAALQAANEAFLLAMDVAPDMATVCVAVVYPSGSVRISLAGHPPPVNLGRTTAAFLTGCVDPPLGVHVNRRQSYAAQLAPGDTLLIYTDGLIERRREPLDQSLARLVATAIAVRGHAARTSDLVDELMRTLALDASDDALMVAATYIE
jgi:serine phosphatase RsbU (regulator of sigma subunit)